MHNFTSLQSAPSAREGQQIIENLSKISAPAAQPSTSMSIYQVQNWNDQFFIAFWFLFVVHQQPGKTGWSIGCLAQKQHRISMIASDIRGTVSNFSNRSRIGVTDFQNFLLLFYIYTWQLTTQHKCVVYRSLV